MIRPTFILTGLLLVFCAQAAAQDAKPAATTPPAAEEAGRRRVPDTLMYSIDELNEVSSRIATNQIVEKSGRGDPDAIEDATLFLSTILYASPNDWTIWVNGTPISAHQEFGSFEITSIGHDFVELLVPLSAQGMRPVRLSPNQTFITKTGTIVEGKWQP